MYYNNEHKDLAENIRFKIIFDYDTKVKIAEDLNISMDVLNNNFTLLRSKKIIVDNKLAKGFRILHSGDDYELTFKFQFDDEPDTKNSKESTASGSDGDTGTVSKISGHS